MQPKDLDSNTPALDAKNLLYPDASILLLGIRGTGKTTLAILASSATGFHLIDADQHFYKTTGLARAVYAHRYGFDVYKAKELALMRELLQLNPRRSIIVCGPGSAEGTGQSIIREFQQNHPVIYILRDPDDVYDYLGTQNIEKVSQLSELVGPSYRSLSNYEFYNLSEPVGPDNIDSPIQTYPGPKLPSHSSLMLKHVESDFLRLIQGIRNQINVPRVSEAEHSLSHLPPEAKPYTYALHLPIDQVSQVAFSLRNTDLIVDAVELEIDSESLFTHSRGHFNQATATYITRQYYLLRRNVKLPVVLSATMSDTSDDLIQSYYLDLLLHCLRLAPEYLAVHLMLELVDINTLIAQKGATKLMGHFFDAHPPEDAWSSQDRSLVMQKAERLGCDLVRICQPCLRPEDNIMVQHFALQARKSNYSNIPLIAYNTGLNGLTSRVMNSAITPVTHQLIATTASRIEAKETLTVPTAQQALYASFVLDKLVFGIFGSAVSAAVSPPMQNAAFQFCGMPHVYQTFQSPTLHNLQHLVYNERFGGASISAPFKQEIISILDYVSPEAMAIGAVNTLIPLRSKKLESLVDRNHAGPVVALYGDNTDWIGIHKCIYSHLSPINAVRPRSTALVLGAGGMARAAIYAALRLGVQTIFVWNRTFKNTERLVNQFHNKPFNVRMLDLTKTSPDTSPQRSGTSTPRCPHVGPAQVHAISSLEDPWPSWADSPTIIVSCISRASERGQPSPSVVLADDWLRSPTGGVVIELSYNPIIDTPLLKQISSLSDKGWIPVDGLQVLPEQGIAQFELFTGRTAPRHLMRSKAAEWRNIKT